MLCMDLFQYRVGALSWIILYVIQDFWWHFGANQLLKLNMFEMPELLSLWKLIRWKRSCKFGLNYCSCRNRNARKDLVSLARIIVLVETAKHAVCLPICPSQAQHFPLRTNKQRNGAAGRLALLNLCHWRNIGFYNHANVNNHHHRRRFASWFRRQSAVAVRSGRDVILRKRSVFVSIAPVPSLCYQYSVQFHTAAEVKKTLQYQDTFILITNADLITSVNIAIVW